MMLRVLVRTLGPWSWPVFMVDLKAREKSAAPVCKWTRSSAQTLLRWTA